MWYVHQSISRCHCSLNWLQDLVFHSSVKLRVADGSSVSCIHGSEELNLSSIEKMKTECSPYILPLFPENEFDMMGSNKSWLCKALGSPDVQLMWSLPWGPHLTEGECYKNRACVKSGLLRLKFLHPEDGGEYACIAKNKYGRDRKTVELEVKASLNNGYYFRYILVLSKINLQTYLCLSFSSWSTSRSFLSVWHLHL